MGMKKRLYIFGIILLGVFVGYSSYLAYHRIENSLIYSNINALCEVEHGVYVKCYDSVKYDPVDQERYCGTCTELPCTFKSGMNFCIPK